VRSFFSVVDLLSVWGDLLGNLWALLRSMGIVGAQASMMLAAVVPFDLDQRLVARSRKGDRLAFSDLVERHQHRIYSICLRWLGDATAAEEIAQDVFLAAWRAIEGFREEARFDVWLRRIAVNKCKNARLSRVRKAHDRHDRIDEEPEDEDGVRLQVAANGPGPDASLDRSIASAILQEGLSRLSEEHRAILVLRDLEDLDYEEISSLLDLPRGTVKSRLHRARVALAEALANRIGPKDVF